MPEPVSLTVTTIAPSSNAAFNVTRPASRRVPQRVRGEVLKRLLEPHRIAGDDLRPWRRCSSAVSTPLLRPPGHAAPAHAQTDPRAAHPAHRTTRRRLRGATRSSKSPTMCSTRWRFVPNDREIALAGFGIERIWRAATASRDSRACRSAASSARATRRPAADAACDRRPAAAPRAAADRASSD